MKRNARFQRPSGPGVFQRVLLAELKRRGWTPYRLAVEAGLEPRHVYRMLRVSLTVPWAERFAAVLGLELRSRDGAR